MNLYNDKYIIVEIIPTSSRKDTGFIAQISALKLEGLKLIDRFDYRINPNMIENEDIKKMISYDNKMFSYEEEKDSLIDIFKKWSEDLPLILIDDTYTIDYFEELSNHKELVYKYLNMDYSFDSINKIIKKYKLEPTNHLVDLIYEANIKKKNNH